MTSLSPRHLTLGPVCVNDLVLCSCKAYCHFSYQVGCKSRCWPCSLTLHPCLCVDHPWSPWALRTVARLSHVEDLVSCGEPSAGLSPICQTVCCHTAIILYNPLYWPLNSLEQRQHVLGIPGCPACCGGLSHMIFRGHYGVRHCLDE